MGVFCGVCGNENRVDAAYCKVCDANLQKFHREELQNKEPIGPRSGLHAIFIILTTPEQSELAYNARLDVFVNVYSVLIAIVFSANFVEETNTIYHPPVLNPITRAAIMLGITVVGMILNTVLLAEIVKLLDRQRRFTEMGVFAILIRMNIVRALCYIPHYLAKLLLSSFMHGQEITHRASGIIPRRTEIVSYVPFPLIYNMVMIVTLVLGALLSAHILYRTLRHVIGIDNHAPFLLAMVSFSWVIFVMTLPYIA